MQVAAEYCVGLCWVLQYYYRGTPSWSWFYPHHYGPMLTDLVALPALMTQVLADGKITSWLGYDHCLWPRARCAQVVKP